MIVNYASSIINELEALLTDNARVIIYDSHVFIVHATEVPKVPEVLRIPEIHNWPFLNVISSIAEMIPKLFFNKIFKINIFIFIGTFVNVTNFFLLIVGGN
jgi:hypothetical protein